MEQAIVDELRIRRVLAEYCQRCDDGDFDRLLDCFAADATFHFGDRTVGGHAALRRFFERTQTAERRGKHLTTNSVIDLAGDRAAVASDFAFLAFVDGSLRPVLVGRYVDEFRRIDAAWVISSRVAASLGPADET